MMNKVLSLLIFTLSCNLAFSQSAIEVLEKSMDYHDPNGEWSELQASFRFIETRPNGTDRSTSMILDNTISYMKLNRNNKEVYQIKGEKVAVLAGNEDATRALMLRNYYLYLWGLPMKLMDPGTTLEDEVSEEAIDGITCYVLKVYYETDTWYFYVDKETGRMVEYKFIKVDSGKGEVIKLKDEVTAGSIKIPKSRSWYTIPENTFLGMDILDTITLKE